jgi:hypothetical protein
MNTRPPKNDEKETNNNEWYNWKAYCEEVMDLMATSFFNLEDFNLQSSIFTAGHTG